jgi:hypothetical protein
MAVALLIAVAALGLDVTAAVHARRAQDGEDAA